MFSVSILKKIILLTLAVTAVPGCTGPRYRVDYGGNKDVYIGAKDDYRAGQKVVFYYDWRMVGTDTDYSFFVDGEELSCPYEEGKGFSVSFVMPEHDVRVECVAKNSMLRTSGCAELTFSSFDGGGPRYTVRLEDPSLVEYEQTQRYGNPKHAEMEGSAYDVIITLEGKKPGTTHMTVEERSPIVWDRDIVYLVEVDEELRVTVTKESESDPDEVTDAEEDAPGADE